MRRNAGLVFSPVELFEAKPFVRARNNLGSDGSVRLLFEFTHQRHSSKILFSETVGLRLVAQALGDDWMAYADPASALARLGGFLAATHRLLGIDDVWCPGHA